MICSWRNTATRKVWEGGRPNRFRGLDFEKAGMRLRAIHRAKVLADLGALRSVGLHRLRGRRGRAVAVSVNGPWRICFELREGDAFHVEIVDTYKG